jgi:hypothetical protein
MEAGLPTPSFSSGGGWDNKKKSGGGGPPKNMPFDKDSVLKAL